MKIHSCQQQSLEWLQLRAGVVTASEIDSLVSETFQVRKGKIPTSYLAQKLAEKWMGGPIADFCSVDMEIGKILENEVLPRLELDLNQDIQRVGFITNDDGQIGCSPDGLIGEDEGLEIKCPQSKNHIAYLLAGEIPPDYVCQVQFSLFVTGRKRWRFVSYHRRMPMLVKTVEPDKNAFDAFDEALEAFLGKMESGWARLVEMNGGREPVRKPIQQTMPQTEPHSDGFVCP